LHRAVVLTFFVKRVRDPILQPTIPFKSRSNQIQYSCVHKKIYSRPLQKWFTTTWAVFPQKNVH